MSNQTETLSLRRVLTNWWPLAASWMLMGLELPALSAVVARLANPQINLAAYGGIVFPLVLIVESPIIMLLAASTTLSKDLSSYKKIYKFMMWTSAILTGLHILTAFTPIYYVIVEKLIGAPSEIVEPARIGLKIMLPWTWAIAYRRFNQGILIRFGHSQTVSTGTAIRLLTNVFVLITGYLLGNVSGIVIATSAVTCGVTAEAIFIGIRVRPVIRDELSLAPLVTPPLTFKAFIQFYIPLAMTSFLMLFVQPIGSAALSRMPNPLESLAAWPVVTGLIFLMRGMGIAFNEVVISLLGEEKSFSALKKFTILLTTASTLLVAVVIVTPLADMLFVKLFALPLELANIAKVGFWLSFLMPGLNAMQSWFQGAILYSQKTRGITESVIVFILSLIIILLFGISRNDIIGLYVGIVAYASGMLFQTAWLWFRSLPTFQMVKERDLVPPARIG